MKFIEKVPKMNQLSMPLASEQTTGAAARKPSLTKGQQLESVFLAEMLKSAGVGKTPDSFGGGAGEDHFSSFLRDAQAREMVRAGGLGLANYFDGVITGDVNEQ